MQVLRRCLVLVALCAFLGQTWCAGLPCECCWAVRAAGRSVTAVPLPACCQHCASQHCAAQDGASRDRASQNRATHRVCGALDEELLPLADRPDCHCTGSPMGALLLPCAELPAEVTIGAALPLAMAKVTVAVDRMEPDTGWSGPWLPAGTELLAQNCRWQE